MKHPTIAAALFVLTGLAAAPVSAQQPRLSVVAGYASLREQGPGFADPVDYTGWSVSGTYRLRGRLSAAADVDTTSRRNLFQESLRLTGVLGGVRYDVLHAGRMTVFAQALAGIERFSEPGFSETGFALQPGAGLDVQIFRPLVLRAQADYRRVRYDDASFSNLRWTAGAGIRLRRRP